MKKCHLTYSYIFTPRVPELLDAAGFDITRESDENGSLIHNLWLQSPEGPFCCRFIEVIDERSLSLEQASNESSLWPGFSLNSPREPAHLSPHFALEGFLVEDHPLCKEQLSPIQLPAPVYFETRATSLDRQLGYKKISPYWALLIRDLSAGPRALVAEKTNTASWHGQDVVWMQLETTSWDILILPSSPTPPI